MKKLFEKYKDVIPYLIFGVLTTVVNYVSYWFFAHVLSVSVLVSTVLAWILAVAFAYVTNRKWVFHSTAVTRNEILKEAGAFLAARIGTGVLDFLIMWIFVDLLHWNDLIVKAAANILVIIINYVASKFFIFKKKDEE